MEKKYFAFISYKTEDAEWAVWLQHELEHYHLPALYNGRDDVNMVKVWSIVYKQCFKTYTLPISAKQVKFLPQGDKIFAFCADSTIKTLLFPSLTEITNTVKARYQHCSISIEDRKKYYLD